MRKTDFRHKAHRADKSRLLQILSQKWSLGTCHKLTVSVLFGITFKNINTSRNDLEIPVIGANYHIMNKLVYFAIFVFGLNLMICAAQENAGIKPTRTWDGSEVDNERLKLPNNNSASFDISNEAILNETDWINLWQAWRGDEAPKIDFTKNLILFCTTRTPNHCSIWLKLSPSGDLKVKRLTTMMYSEAKTFNYKIVLVKRAGIMTINGKPITPRRKRLKRSFL